MLDFNRYKYIIKLFIRDSVSFFVYILLIIKKRILNENDAGIRILVYHSINNIDKKKDTARISVPPELFRKQVDFIVSRGYRIISLDNLVDYVSGGNDFKDESIVLTFDDGFGDNFDYAYNILKSKGLKATFFLTCDYMDSNKALPWSDGSLARAKPMSWENASTLVSGGMSIGSHTLSHADLGSISNDKNKLDREIRASKEIIEEKLNIAVKYFAYPIGSRSTYNNKTEDLIRVSGYKAACINIFGTNKRRGNVFQLRRTRIDWNDTLFKFRMKLEGAYDWVDGMSFCGKRKIKC